MTEYFFYLEDEEEDGPATPDHKTKSKNFKEFQQESGAKDSKVHTRLSYNPNDLNDQRGSKVSNENRFLTPEKKVSFKNIVLVGTKLDLIHGRKEGR